MGEDDRSSSPSDPAGGDAVPAAADPPPRIPSERPEPMPAVDEPASGDRATRELPPRREPEDEAPTLEIEPVAPSVEAETLRRPQQPAQSKKARPRNVARWLRRIAVVLVAVVTALAIVLAVAFDSIARWYVTFEAERRGIFIEAREMSVEWGRASFWDATIRLEGAPALVLHAEWLEVEALGFHPTHARMRGVDVEASSIDAIRQGLAFGRTHGSDLLPVDITDVRAVMGRAPGAAPVLDGKVASVVFEPGEALLAKGAVVTVARPKLVLGPIDVVADARGSLIQLGIGADVAKSPVKIDADLDSRQLAIDLPTTPASTIAGWLGRKQKPGAAPWPGAFSIRAKLTGTWLADARSGLAGHVDATLIGIVPPHPPELNGIATGSDTVTQFDFRMGPQDEGIALEKLGVVVGALRLEGIGRIVPREPSFVATANLRGSIPCRDLVGTVAVSQLGLALGSTLGALVRQNVAGNVDVTVAIQVDGERIASPDVRPSATIGCRLRLL